MKYGMMKAVGVLVSVILVTTRAEIYVGCGLRTDKDFLNNQPLVLKKGQDMDQEYEFDDPDEGNSMLFEPGEDVLLACPGSSFHKIDDIEETTVNVKCVGDKEFETENENRPFQDFSCENIPQSKLKKKGQCNGDKTALVIGFEVNEAFVKLVDICFDEEKKIPLYAKHKITRGIKGAQTSVKRKNFEVSPFFKDVSISSVYGQKEQTNAFGEALKKSNGKVSLKVVQQYINQNDRLVRGHLAPKADFVFAPQQTATFYYVNSAPQWISFNGGNWARLERYVRILATKIDSTLTIYTGTWGLYEVSGKQRAKDSVRTPVFLASNRKTGEQAVPVPLVFWKIVYDKAHGQAVAFVGLNDPSGDSDQNAARSMCPDKCSEITWVQFEPITKKGLMYCCDVSELVKTIGALPKLPEHLSFLTG